MDTLITTNIIIKIATAITTADGDSLGPFIESLNLVIPMAELGPLASFLEYFNFI